MRFIGLLGAAVDARGAGKAALFFAVFALLFVALAALFTAFLVAAFAPGSQVGWGSVAFLVAVVLVMWAGGAFFCVVTLALAFGRVQVVRGAWPAAASPGFDVVQTRVVRLWGLDLVREYHGAWQAIVPQPRPAELADVPWSWAAFARLDAPDARGPAMIVDAAVWQLVVHDAARLRVRPEARHLLGRAARRGMRQQLHAHAGSDAGPPLGAWERALMAALAGRDAEQPLALHDWIAAAFGASAGDPMRVVRERAADDVQRHAAPDAPLQAAWPPIRACIDAHAVPGVDVPALVFDGVRDALRDQTDTS